MNEDNKSSKVVGITIAVIVGILLLIWIIVKMTNNKADDTNLNNAANGVKQGTQNAANDVKNGAEDLGKDVMEGTKDVAEGVKDTATDIKDGIIKAFDLENKENVTISDGMKTNTSEKFKETKTFENLSYSNATLTGKNTGANFKVSVKNNSNTDFSKRTATIKFTNSNGNEIGNATIEIPNIKKGEEKTVESKIMSDIANAYDYTISYK